MRRETWFGVIVATVAVGLTLLGAELVVRALGSDEKRWDFRNFVADPLALKDRWQSLMPDELLGYVPRPGYSGTHRGGAHLTFDSHGLRRHPNAAPTASAARPVLVVGDSYAMGEEVDDNETFPAHLEKLLRRPVLNGGVLGYGIDQIVLRAEQLVPQFRPEQLIVSFIADDIRRTGMKVMWGVPKPYFEVEGDGLALRNVPVPPPIDSSIGPVRAVLGYSFAADVLMRRLGLASWWLRGQSLHTEPAHDQAELVSCRLMERLWRLSKAHKLRVLVVAQYTPEIFERVSTRRFELGGTRLMLQCAQEWGFGVIDTWRPVEQAVQQDGLEHYYLARHMNDAGNRLTAELIARHFEQTQTLQASDQGGKLTRSADQ